jgi:hypothetical protein
MAPNMWEQAAARTAARSGDSLSVAAAPFTLAGRPFAAGALAA